MQLFAPFLSLRRQADGRYALHALTETPSNRYFAGAARAVAPRGIAVPPEVLPATLEIRRRGGAYRPAVTPVDHLLRGLRVGAGTGKRAVAAFAVLDGQVVGASTVAVAGGSPAGGPAGGPAGPDAGAPGPLGTRAWYAWADRMPPGPASLHVVGQVLAPTPCFAARLTPASPPASDPRQLVLEVALSPTRRVCPEVPTWIEARFDLGPYRASHREVAIRCGGEVDALVPIEEVA